MHNCVTSHLWLKSALHASSHPCMCTCVLRLGCFLFISPVFYFVPPFSFQPFLMFTLEFNERSRSNPLCDFRLGTVATSDHETPLTKDSVIFSGGDSSKNYGADQQRLQISDLHFDKFPTPATFACWKIRFKTEVCTCSQVPTKAMQWIREVELVESVDELRSSSSTCKENVSCTSYSRTFGYGILT